MRYPLCRSYIVLTIWPANVAKFFRKCQRLPDRNGSERDGKIFQPVRPSVLPFDNESGTEDEAFVHVHSTCWIATWQLKRGAKMSWWRTVAWRSRFTKLFIQFFRSCKLLACHLPMSSHSRLLRYIILGIESYRIIRCHDACSNHTLRCKIITHRQRWERWGSSGQRVTVSTWRNTVDDAKLSSWMFLKKV